MLNYVNDQDRQWWPFLFLRPEPDENMGNLRVLGVSLLLGFFFGMLANIGLVLTASHEAARLRFLAIPPWATLPLCTTVAFFLFFRATFAFSWNRRARRLSRTAPIRSQRR